ncbi:MAG: hypothetical protein GEU94_06690 [Micromonosporaceae bacterium]|nr:hypothetical protein [Micromonosporaceae bacterium]
MRWATFLLVLAHLGVGGVWLGAMAYSLTVAQPAITRLFPRPEAAEEAYRELAARNRWRVVGLLAVLAGSGVALAALAGPRPLAWWLLIAAKTGLFVAAAGLFWWVSWRGWPRRLFALPEELAPLQRRFRHVAVALAACGGAAFVLGVAAASLAS